MDHVRAQEQLVVVTIALAGVAASFSGQLALHPELVAVIGLLFMLFAHLVLSHDQQITLTARYLSDEDVFGEHARVQSGWERYKVAAMRGSGWIRQPATFAKVLSLYGAPVISGVVFSVAAVVLSPANWHTWLIVLVTVSFLALFAFAGVRTMQEYVALGRED